MQHAAVGVAERAVDFRRGHVVQHVEQVGDVEADVERLAGVVDFELFLGFFLLAVGADDAQAVRRQHPAHAAELFVGQDGRALQRLQQHHPAERDVLLVVGRDDAV